MAKTTKLASVDGDTDIDTDDGEGTKRFKNFGSIPHISEMPPLEFELCGKTFHCKPGLQSKKMLNFVRRVDSESGASAGEALYDFMETALMPDDVEAWREIIDGEDYIVDASKLGEIVTWLVEQYSARPTQQ